MSKKPKKTNADETNTSFIGVVDRMIQENLQRNVRWRSDRDQRQEIVATLKALYMATAEMRNELAASRRSAEAIIRLMAEQNKTLLRIANILDRPARDTVSPVE